MFFILTERNEVSASEFSDISILSVNCITAFSTFVAFRSPFLIILRDDNL